MLHEEICYLVLGCFGREDDGFVSCPSVENRILRLDDSLVYIDDIMNYMESVSLFDRHMLDINSIRHLVYNLQDRYDQKIKRMWNEQQYHLLERFIQSHRPCGLYAKLILVPEADKVEAPKKQDRILVKGTPVIEHAERRPVLKVIRGKR